MFCFERHISTFYVIVFDMQLGWQSLGVHYFFGVSFVISFVEVLSDFSS